MPVALTNTGVKFNNNNTLNPSTSNNSISINGTDRWEMVGYFNYVTSSPSHSTTVNTWIDAYSFTYTRKHTNSYLLVECDAKLALALAQAGGGNYGGVNGRLKFANSVTNYTSNFNVWLRADFDASGGNVKEIQKTCNFLYSEQGNSYFGIAGTVTTITPQYYNATNAGTYGRGGYGVWAGTSIFQITEWLK